MRESVEEIYRRESRAVLASLIRLLGDFDLAEEALHEAFRAALEHWDRDGMPDNPRAWLISAGRFKAIDAIRRQARFEPFDPEKHDLAAEDSSAGAEALAAEPIEDDRLRLIFTCCHPALAREAQVALTLREVCGLTTEEIAHAFLTTPATLAQRIVRAKAKIRDAKIPYEVPQAQDLPERLASVLQVIYLVFNEGYAATVGASLTRSDLCVEAIRLGRLLAELLPEPEVLGLLALLLLHDSRRDARTSLEGDPIVLEDQDRTRWNREQIREGAALVERAMQSGRAGSYGLQAAISSVHANAPDAGATDWRQIVRFYDALLFLEPGPVVALNRAVAVSMSEGPAQGLALVDEILEKGELSDYRFAHAARADFCRRLGQTEEARRSYERALALSKQDAEQRFLRRRLESLRIHGTQ